MQAMVANYQNTTSSSDQTPVKGNELCFNKLLELGLKINTKDFAGYTPLHHCTTKFANDETKKMAQILL